MSEEEDKEEEEEEEAGDRENSGRTWVPAINSMRLARKRRFAGKLTYLKYFQMEPALAVTNFDQSRFCWNTKESLVVNAIALVWIRVAILRILSMACLRSISAQSIAEILEPQNLKDRASPE